MFCSRPFPFTLADSDCGGEETEEPGSLSDSVEYSHTHHAQLLYVEPLLVCTDSSRATTVFPSEWHSGSLVTTTTGAVFLPEALHFLHISLGPLFTSPLPQYLLNCLQELQVLLSQSCRASKSVDDQAWQVVSRATTGEKKEVRKLSL